MHCGKPFTVKKIYALLCADCSREKRRIIEEAEQKILQTVIKCPTCNGKGWIKGYRCLSCRGRGSITKKDLNIFSRADGDELVQAIRRHCFEITWHGCDEL